MVGGGAGLAATGADLVWWIAFAIMLLLAGLFLLRSAQAGRRGGRGGWLRRAAVADATGDLRP